MTLFLEHMNDFGRWLAGHLGQMSVELLVLAVVVYGLIVLLRIKSPTLRHLFWCLVLIKPVASFLMVSPISLYALLPERAVPVVVRAEPVPLVEQMAAEPIQTPSLAVPVEAPEHVPVATPVAAPVPAPAPRPALDRYGVLALGWSLISATLLARLLLGLAYVAYLRAKAETHPTGVLVDAVREAVRALPVKRGVRVSLSREVQSPVLTGILRPIVLFPTALAEGMTAQQLRLVLAHELAHAQRWDNAWLLIQRLAESLLFFHPVVWICGRMMRKEAEFACDGAVLASYAESAEYADSLTRVAEIRQGFTRQLMINTCAAAESNLASRIRRILAGGAIRNTVGVTLLAVVALIVIGCVGLPGAAARKAADKSKPPPDAAGKTIAELTEPEYDVNAHRVMSDEEAAVARSESGERLYAGTEMRNGALEEVYYGADSRQPFTGVSVKKFANGQIERTCDFKNGQANGFRREWYPSGARMTVMSVEDHLRHGPETRWYANGQVSLEGNYWHGWKDGPFNQWYDDGKPRFKAFYQGSIQDRLTKEWRKKRLWEEYGWFFQDGIPQGVFTDWYPTGQKRFEGETSEDYRLLRLSSWSEDGVEHPIDPQMLEKSNFLSESGETLYPVQEMRNGTMVWACYGAGTQQPFTGRSVKKYPNGQIERTCEYQNGLPNGLRREWYEDGARMAVTSLKDDVRHGPEQRWYANGQMSLDGAYWHGWKDGQFNQWWADGKPRFNAFYRGQNQDRLVAEWRQKPLWPEYAYFFESGIPEGVFTYWYANGQKQFEGEISKDYRLLRLTTWSEDGTEHPVDPRLLKEAPTAASAGSPAALDYAAVIEAARGVGAYSYVERHADTPPETDDRVTFYVKDRSHTRCVATANMPGQTQAVRSILIADFSQRALLNLYPSEKRATVMRTSLALPPDATPSAQDADTALAAELKRYAEQAEQSTFGPTNLDGRPVIGFEFRRHLPHGEMQRSVWVDAKTHLPVRVEEVRTMEADPTKVIPASTHLVRADFAYNIPLDDSLFSVTPPSGYTVRTEQESPALPLTEDRFLQGLRRWAELNGNGFPDELTQDQALHAQFKLVRATNQVEATQLLYGVLAFVRTQHEAKRPWHYAGKGVKLDQPDTPVFWYQPEGSDLYRVVYADLSVRDVPADQLPVAGQAVERIGVYDSRAIAVAFVGSAAYQASDGKKMSDMMAEHAKAKAEGNQQRVSELEAWGKAQQALLHQQAFGTAPVDDILAHIHNQMPGIAKAAGASAVVSKWDQAELAKHPSAELVDVTMALVDAFKPTESQRQRAVEIQKSVPIPTEQAESNQD